MPSTYTSNLGIEKPGTGEQSGTWGDTANVNYDIVDTAINGVLSLSLSGTTSTLTTTDGSVSDGHYKVLVLGGSPSGTHTITISPNDADKVYFVQNSSGQSVVFTQGSGGNVTIADGDSAIIYADGAGAGAAVANLTDAFAMSSVKITGGAITGITDLAVADGGTGASTAANARTNLGLGTIATQSAASVAITGGSITGITDLAVADGGTGSSTASGARTNLGLGTIATQSAANVAITGGTIDATTVGATTPAAGNFTDVDVSGTLSHVPAGFVAVFAMSTAPTGFLKANGAAVSRTTYATLFAAIGTTFGSGDGSTTFNLPDLRGEFIRGYDDGRGVDSARVFGSSQLDQMQQITGAIGPFLRSTISTNTGALSYTDDGPQTLGGSTNRNFGVVTFDSANSPSARTGTETRARNVALLACIKY